MGRPDRTRSARPRCPLPRQRGGLMPLSATSPARARILLIDDAPGIRNFVSRGLRDEGFTVDLAADGDAGLNGALGPPYDLIILDLLLPDLGGIDLLHRLIRQHP